MTVAKGKGVPDHIAQLLSAADGRNGLPPGTMASVMQQEIGGNFDKYLADPAAYHYEKNGEGRRVAGHTGKVSTAFGPFGILESTGADPGYGVKPLQNKSIDEQVRFASDYLAARSKSAGGLAGGLAGYGEGAKYAQQVAGRMGGRVAAPVQGVQVAAVPTSAVEGVPLALPDPGGQPPPNPVVAQGSSPVVPSGLSGQDPWEMFNQLIQRQAGAAAPVQVADLSGYGGQPMQAPNFNLSPVQSRPIDFRAFGSWGGGKA